MATSTCETIEIEVKGCEESKTVPAQIVRRFVDFKSDQTCQIERMAAKFTQCLDEGELLIVEGTYASINGEDWQISSVDHGSDNCHHYTVYWFWRAVINCPEYFAICRCVKVEGCDGGIFAERIDTIQGRVEKQDSVQSQRDGSLFMAQRYRFYTNQWQKFCDESTPMLVKQLSDPNKTFELVSFTNNISGTACPVALFRLTKKNLELIDGPPPGIDESGTSQDDSRA